MGRDAIGRTLARVKTMMTITTDAYSARWLECIICGRVNMFCLFKIFGVSAIAVNLCYFARAKNRKITCFMRQQQHLWDPKITKNLTYLAQDHRILH